MYFLKRGIAFIIDLVIILVITIPIILAYQVKSNAFKIESNNQLIMQLIIVFIYIMYSITMEYFFGRSIGKRLFGLTLKSIDNSKITLWKIISRNLFRIIDQGLFVGYFLVLFSKKRQRIGDFIAKIIIT